MKLEALAGNEGLKRQLSAQRAGRGLSHAYLISGPAGSGKGTLARLLAAAFVCSGEGEPPCGCCPGCKKALGGVHPDIITVGAEGKEISADQARSIRGDAYIRPNEAGRKVYVIQNAQSMNGFAQNALLKLLEEGPSYAAFLLLADNPAALLPTIRSRCETLALSPLSRRETEVWLSARFPNASREQVEGAAARCGGFLGQAVEELSGGQADHSAARTLISHFASGDELALAAHCVTLEKLERSAFVALLDQSVLLLRHALALQAGVAVGAGGEDLGCAKQAALLERRHLLRGVERLEGLRADAAFNVGVGHLCGALAAGLAEARMESILPF